MSISFMIAFLCIISPIVAVIFVTCLFTLITVFRAILHRRTWSSYQTALFRGRVSHVRFQPKVHSFSYPIFFFLIDLFETSQLFQDSSDKSKSEHESYPDLWPLSTIMSFHDRDHLKNGEGISRDGSNNTLWARIQRLVTERTCGKITLHPSQPILLLTHLSYFGYCFNPVSFYYILKSENDDTIEAIVAEVSNTPWLEMKCYVLHPDSIDLQGGSSTRDTKTIHYIFPKRFHVSPFMDMDHMYDWTFSSNIIQTLTVSTGMKKATSGEQYFNAFLNVSRKSLYPTTLCLQLLYLPFFCIIVQIWIHFEAARLMLKGIVFIPHPQGSTTRASRIIERVTRPFFFIFNGKGKRD
jgi:DUF1365 family protein